MDIKDFIMEKARQVNIDLIGFTDGDPMTNLKDILLARQATEFEEGQIEKRIDPSLTLKNCKSIIVCGLSYKNDFTIKRPKEAHGILSKSSWGLDYHRVLKDRLEKLILHLKDIGDFDYKYFVDTGPLVDRELAKKAGLGYYGKNCSLINPDYGSFIFIGYILTSLDLEGETEVLASQCGDCNLCLRACPTGALEAPYKLNPRKCISYLSQVKDIPQALRPKLQNKIYGCDTCQDVCPKNKDIIVPNHKEFIPEVTKGIVYIEELFKMSNREFSDKYGSMAGAWRGLNNLRKNGLINLLNMKYENSRDIIRYLENSESKLLKEYIDWSLIML